jgi:hypothetical protein
MKRFAEYALRSLGIKLQEDQASFMETYGKKLPEHPASEKSWIGGLGLPDFVIGTTLALANRKTGPKVLWTLHFCERVAIQIRDD